MLDAQRTLLGNFQVIFSPLAREAGRYQVGANIRASLRIRFRTSLYWSGWIRSRPRKA